MFIGKPFAAKKLIAQRRGRYDHVRAAVNAAKGDWIPVTCMDPREAAAVANAASAYHKKYHVCRQGLVVNIRLRNGDGE
jgi:hypothetical protein